MIKKCQCKSGFQDKRYGKQMRVYNQGDKELTCTVCGNKIVLSFAERKN